MTGVSAPLIDRETELAALQTTLDDADAGTGATTLILGPAGIGKTALASVLRERAEARGFAVLSARASELDRAFGYGVVHQLIEPVLATAGAERRAQLLRGAAARAELVLDAAGDQVDAGSYAVVHGLYWLIANLAEERPQLLLIDDLHWADAPSLRFLEYLGRRLDGLRVLVAATARTNEPNAETELVDAIAAGPTTQTVAPRPFGDHAVDAILTDALGHACDPAFVAAATSVTSGNPLLVRVVAREAASLGLAGTAAEGGRLTELAARGVVPTVRRQLGTLGPAAQAVATSAAVAGERALLGDIASLSGHPVAATRGALDDLAAAGILEPGGWTFVHPLVKAAVLEDAPAALVSAQHRAAAEQLRARGARPAEVALHWLATDPVGDPDAVRDLRASAALAAAEGATEVAAEHLERALLEPPPATDVAAITLELGELEVRAQLASGPDRLRALLATGALEGNDLARARAAFGNFLVHTDPMSALDEVAQALEIVTDPALRLQLEAFTLESLIFPNPFAEARDVRLADGKADTDPSVVMLAHLALQGGCAGEPATDVTALADRALADGSFMRALGPGGSTYNLLTHAFRFAEAHERCAQTLRDGERIVAERGLVAAQMFINQSWGYWHRDFGSVAAGAARSRLGLDAVREMGFPLTIPALTAITAENLIHLRQWEAAAVEIDQDVGGAAETFIEPFALTTRGYLRFLLGRHVEAEADLRRVVQLGDDRGWHAPNATRGRLRLAELLASTNRHDEALELMDHDVRVARAAGLAGGLGSALRIRARAQADHAEAVATLQDAVASLRPSPFRLELGWALADLGLRLRATGDDAAAREPLREALDLAAATESTWLADTARDALQAAGGRPRRERLSGTEALTPAERRTAELAAEGMTNRQIAESLWVTLKTVEVHLGRCYAKLGISSRRELADALDPSAAPA